MCLYNWNIIISEINLFNLVSMMKWKSKLPEWGKIFERVSSYNVRTIEEITICHSTRVNSGLTQIQV